MIAKARAVANTPEARAKKSASLKGRILTDPAKTRAAMMGHPVSVAAREKIRQKLTGRRRPQHEKDKIAATLRQQHARGDRDRVNPQKWAHTVPELVMRDLLTRAGVEILDQAQPITRYEGHRIGPVDFYLPVYRIAIEVDGTYWHSGRFPTVTAKDRRKDAAYAAARLPLWRFTEAELRERPGDAWRRLLKGLTTRILTAA